jgi:hypothetical protein
MTEMTKDAISGTNLKADRIAEVDQVAARIIGNQKNATQE